MKVVKWKTNVKVRIVNIENGCVWTLGAHPTHDSSCWKPNEQDNMSEILEFGE
jgi:hypothetical protein